MRMIANICSWLLRVSACFALVAAGILLLNLAEEVPKIIPQIQYQGDQTRALVDQVLDRELTKTRDLIAVELNQTRDRVLAELDRSRADVIERGDARLASIQADLNAQLSRAESDLNARLAETNNIINTNLETSLKPINRITDQMAESSELLLDCDHNPECFANRWIGMTRAAELSAESTGRLTVLLEQSAPVLLENSTRVTDNVSKITADVAEATHAFVHPPWYKKVLNVITVAGAALITLIK